MSKSELKRMCTQNPVEMAARIAELERQLEEAQAKIDAINAEQEVMKRETK